MSTATSRARRKKKASAKPRAKKLTRPVTPPAPADPRVRELEDELADLRNELERSERRVEAMKQIGRVLGSNLKLDPLLSEVVSRTTELLEADRSTLFLLDHEKKELWSKVLEGKDLREIRLPCGKGIAGWVAKHGKPVHIRDAYADKRFNPEFDRRSGYVTRGMLAWPVRRPHGELIGVIQVLNKRDGVFNATDERLLEAIASEIGVALEVARLYHEAVERSEALEKAQRELELLFETERAISQSEDLAGMLASILETALAAMSARAGVVHLLDDRGLRLEVIASAGPHAGSLKAEIPMQVGEGIAGNVVKMGEPVTVNDLQGTMRGRLSARSIVAVPIVTKYAGTIGVLELINKLDRRGFTSDDIKALTVVAAQAGRAITAEQRRKERERSERLTTIGRMLSGIIHDLRTPMTLISGYTQVMALSDSPADRDNYARAVLKQVEVLSAMTKDLLAFAKGERSILIRKVYVQRFMQEMKEYLDREFEGSGVTFETDVRYRGAARFDETKLRRVFHNIARNAREAMPGGGRFTIAVDAKDGSLTFDFSDTGSGIPAELEGKLFEPFSTSGKVGGTGLGLAMVKQIADEHRGTVGYASKPGRGTTFTFTLPLESA
ncbi:GAF domain-containing protein [Myxococcota bacterium]|nr:GAF domain-containing protein [Myxococcota bacterium]